MRGRFLTFLTCWILIGMALPAVAQPNRITSHIDNSRTVVLSGRTLRLANSDNDAGPVESGFSLTGITLSLARSAAQQADLDQLLLAQQNPARRPRWARKWRHLRAARSLRRGKKEASSVSSCNCWR